MGPEVGQGVRRSGKGTPIPAELERALRNCSAALRSLGAAEDRIGRQLAAVQADLAVLSRRPPAAVGAEAGERATRTSVPSVRAARP